MSLIHKCKAEEHVVRAIDAKFGTNYLLHRTPDMIYSTVLAPPFVGSNGKTVTSKSVFYIKLNHQHDISKHCPLVRKKSRTHGSGRTNYSVNISSGKVVCMCFGTKCRERNGGKYVMVDACDQSSSEESDYESSEDEEDDEDDEDEATPSNKKRKRDGSGGSAGVTNL